MFAKSTEQTRGFPWKTWRSVHSGPFQGTTSRWMETPCYTCLGPLLASARRLKATPCVEVMEHNEAERMFAASPTCVGKFVTLFKDIAAATTVKVFLPFLTNTVLLSYPTGCFKLCIRAISWLAALSLSALFDFFCKKKSVFQFTRFNPRPYFNIKSIDRVIYPSFN